jgi:hypothetical protein
MFPTEEPAQPICSAKGCRAEPDYVLVWNNPKLHTPDRRKTWLACGEHREHLGQFLAVRGFLKDTVPFGEWTAQEKQQQEQGQGQQDGGPQASAGG